MDDAKQPDPSQSSSIYAKIQRWRIPTMPLAKKFRAMMDFPFPGDTMGNFTVESVDVYVVKEDKGGIVYGVRMALSGPGKVQNVQQAIKALFSQHPTTFSGYGNPYQLWFMKPEIESQGEQRYAVTVQGAGARVYLEPELMRFLQYLNESNHLAALSDPAAQETLVETYLERYRLEIQRRVGRYTRKLEKSHPGGQPG
jgi:hypothetical protein